MNWDDRWMDLASFISGWSKDRSRKTGAVIVDGRNSVVSIGWNGFPRGLDDDVDLRHERPAKYRWTEHAERNAIYNAAAVGVSTAGCKMYVMWYPCADCARAIVQAGIVELIAVEPDWDDQTYSDDFQMVREMLSEIGLASRYLPGRAAPVRR